MADSTPALATDTRHGRRYAWKVEGEKDPTTYDSVTTIINELSKPALPHWYANQAASFAVDNLGTLADLDRKAAYDLVRKAAERQRDGAADRGTAVHQAVPTVAGMTRHDIQAALDDIRQDLYEPEVEPYMAGATAYLSMFVEVEMQEATGFNDKLGFAGTFDLAGTLHDGSRVLADWKTGKSVYKEAALQLALYSMFETVAVPDEESGLWRREPMPSFNTGHVVHLQPDGQVEVYEVDLCDARLVQAATSLVELASWRRSRSLWYDRRFNKTA